MADLIPPAISLLVEMAAFAPQVSERRRDLEIYVAQYAAELGHDLGLPAEISVQVRLMPPEESWGPNLFRLLVDGQPCRQPWWPAPALVELPAQEIAAVVAGALYRSRACLLTPGLTGRIAAQWKLEDGWPAGFFEKYLAAFARWNFAIERGREFAERHRTAPGAQFAETCVEQALEESPDLRLGPAVDLDATQSEKEQAGSRNWGAMVSRLSGDLGLVLKEMEVAGGQKELQKGEFRIRLNDLRLPAFRAPQSGTPNFPDYLVESVERAVRSQAGSFLAAPVVQYLADRLKKEAPDLIRLAEERNAPNGDSFRWLLTSILRNLLDEQVSIRDLRGIVESLLCLRETNDGRGRYGVLYMRRPYDAQLVAVGKRMNELGVEELSDCARYGVRSLALPYASRTFPLDPEMEQRLMDAAGEAPSEAERRRIRLWVQSTVAPCPAHEPVAILCNQSLRRALKETLRVEFPSLAVVGRYEALPMTGKIAPAPPGSGPGR